MTNAARHVTTFNSYDLDGRPTQVTDANGMVTLTYKPRGWLESRTVDGEATTYNFGSIRGFPGVLLPSYWASDWASYGEFRNA